MTNTKTVFMFSGQGSQYFQMGRELFSRAPGFREEMMRLDTMARELCGSSIVAALYADSHERSEVFDRTLLTHPAIFLVEYSMAQMLIRKGVAPDITLGSSLGSFAAAAVAGFIRVEDALAAVIRQAQMLEASCKRGGMIAVLAEATLYEHDYLSRDSELAAVSFPGHFVISFPRANLEGIEAALRQRAVNFQRLPVSFAFHSRWIDPARVAFTSFMKSIPCRAGRLPMMCCDRAASLQTLPDDYFWCVARNPIRFQEAVGRLERDGPCRYIDVGPAGTLATFLKYCMPSTSRSSVHSILTPYASDEKNLAALLQSHASWA